MFKVSFSSIQDVLDFVGMYGSIVPLHKQKILSPHDLGFIDQAVTLSKNTGETWLHTLSDTYSENNGHREVVILTKNIQEEFNLCNILVKTLTGYGNTEITFFQYLSKLDKSEKIELLDKVMSYHDLVHDAVKLHGKIR